MRFPPSRSPRGLRGAIVAALICAGTPRGEAATWVVTSLADAGPGTLRAAMAEANATPGGDRIEFAVEGVLRLASALPELRDPTEIVGPGSERLEIAGAGNHRLMVVQSGTRQRISGLRLSGGAASDGDGGAGVRNLGTLELVDCTLHGHRTVGGLGGAIYSDGGLTLVRCRVSSNTVTGGSSYSGGLPGGGGGGGGLGGGIFSMSGPVSLVGCVFEGNAAMGGSSSNQPPGLEGYNEGGGPNGGVGAGARASAEKNGGLGGGGGGGGVGASGGSGGVGGGGGGAGAAIPPVTRAGGSAFGGGAGGVSGVAAGAGYGGGGGGGAGLGGGLFVADGSVRALETRWIGNRALGGNAGGDYTGGEGGGGFGGAIFAEGGRIHLQGCTLIGNSTEAGFGAGGHLPGRGGPAGGAALFFRHATSTLIGCTVAGNTARAAASSGGSRGGSAVGGDALGGGMTSWRGTTFLTNCTISGNAALGGPGGWIDRPRSGGPAWGGGLMLVSNQTTLVHCTVVSNRAVGGPSGASFPGGGFADPPGASAGGGFHQTGGEIRLAHNVVFANTTGAAARPEDGWGDVTSLATNLWGDTSHIAGAAAWDLVGRDPRLGPLLEGFGPTPVHAIGEGSAAADAAGGAFVPRIDQRGVSRPYGAAADLGAYERRDATDPGAWILVDGELADGPSVTRVGGAWVSVGSSIPGGRVFVTSDGSEPSPLGRAYSGTFEVTASATLRAVVYTPDLASSVAARPVDVVVEPRATYALRVTTIGEGRVAVDPPGPYHSGTVVRLMAIPADRWAFSGWGGDFAGSSPRIEWLVNSDREVMAAFEALRYAELTVTRAGDGEVRIDPPTGPYLVGTRVRLEAIPSTNWEFAGWSGGLTGSTLVTSWVAETNTTVHAEFLALPRYPVSVSVEGYGSVQVDPPGPDYPIRTPVTLRAVDPSGPGGMGGWTFSRWKGDFPGTRNPITIRVARPARVVAEFVYRPWDGERYFLVVAESGAGRVLVDPQPSVAETYPVGTIVTMSAEAFPGWQFLQWSGDVAGSTGIKQVRVDRNLSVVGVFGTRLEPRVETSGGITGGVDLDPPLTYFPPGTRVRLTAIPGAGAAFTGWAGSLAGTNNPIEYVVNTVVPFAGVCRFGPLPAGQRALTLRTEGFGRVSTDPSGATVGVGTRVEFRAIPDLGQDFVGWGGDMTGTEPTRILTLDTSKSVTARFTRRPALAWVDRLGYGRTGSFRLGIRGMPGERYRVESSTDLKAWTPRQSISLRMHAEDLAIPGPGTESGAYFRAIQVSP